MFYNKQINQALRICYIVHKDQFDKSDVPYVFHPFTVANNLPNPTTNEIIVALLHDVFEDHPDIVEESWFNNFYVTLDDEVKEALSLLTHKSYMGYDAYIYNISLNKIATKVKIADLQHNMMLTRLSGVLLNEKKTIDRYFKYQTALNYLIDNGAK